MDPIKEETPLTIREFIIVHTCIGTVRDILSGGYRVQPAPPGNSVTLATSIYDTDTGNSSISEKPLTRGNPTSPAPVYTGTR
jgi:hypothetical protein